MRKTIFMFMICLLSFTMILSGCTSSDESGQNPESGNEKVKLTLLSWENEAAMKPVLDGFAGKHPEIEIDLQWAPPVKDYISKLQTMLLSNSATDLFIMAAENRNELIEGNYVMDLSDQPFMENVAQINKETYSKDGSVYTLSPTGWVGGLYYNKELFEQAGIEKEPATWQEFVDVCIKLKEAGIIPLYDSVQDVPTVLTALYGAENITSDPKVDSKIFAGEKTFEESWTNVFELWNEGLVKNKIVSPNLVGVSGDQMLNEFIAGNVAMMAGGPWNIPTIVNGNPDLDFNMMAIPGTKAGSNYYVGAPGVGFSVNKNTEHKEEALAFLEYLASPEGLQKYQEGTGQIVTVKGFDSEVHPSLQNAYQEGLLQEKIYLPMISWERHQEALRNEFVISTQELLIGKITPNEAAVALDEKLKEMEGN